VKVELIDISATDLSVVNAARVSFAQRHDGMEEGDDKLISFLLRNRHGTPFEHGYFKFHVEAPIFVFREWHRHRVGHSYNEMSARYVKLEPRFYEPKAFRTQHGKPGAYTFVDSEDTELNEAHLQRMREAYEHAWKYYEYFLESGVAKEQARAVLPVGIYTQMIWSCNPRSLMHFLSLRNSPFALKEIRELAQQAEDVFAMTMPITHQAFVDAGRVAP